MDELLYGNKHRTLDDWVQQWPERERKYAIGTHELAEAYVDLDQDGKLDRIIQASKANFMCSYAPANVQSVQERKVWNNTSLNEQLTQANKNGFFASYYLVKDKQLISVATQKLVSYKGRYLYVKQLQMRYKNRIEGWQGKNMISIFEIEPKLNIDSIRFEGSRICEFWLND